MELSFKYRYHPDYLGHTEFVSDANGDAYQYFWYSPFGDAIVEEHANTASFSSRYLFNAKELDPETGRYYYGARYYDPGLSIWLSVDPLAHKNPSLTPYNFVENNPLNLIDPDGRNAWKPDGEGGWIAQPGDGAESLARDAKIPLEDAYKAMEEQGYGTYTDDDGVVKSAVDPGDVVQIGEISSSPAPISSCSSSSTPVSSGNPESQDVNKITADEYADASTIFGLTMMGKEGLIKAISPSGSLTPAVLKYLAGVAILGSAAGVGTSYLQYEEANQVGNDLDRQKAKLRMGTNAVSWWFPVGTGIWAGSEISIFLNPSMEVPKESAWTENRVGCFIKGTMISTNNGQIPIENIAVGDSIQSVDGLSLDVGFSVVNQVFKTKDAKAVFIIKLEGGDSLALSESHPVYTKTNGWRAINPSLGMKGHNGLNLSKLQIGDEVMCLNNSGELFPLRIISIQANGKFVHMYNLIKVEGDNTFFANKILVHNKFTAK